MRIIAFTAFVAAASAIKIQKSAMDDIEDFVMDGYDWDMDGELNEDEFIAFATYMDEDMYLTDDEYAWAMQQYEYADPENAIWLTDTFSSAASGEDAMANMTEESFTDFAMKLGAEDWEAAEMWDEADWNGDGELDLWEQDDVWWGLMEDNRWGQLETLEDTAWDILDTVWEMQDDLWEEEGGCCWDDGTCCWDGECDWECNWDGAWDGNW